jgi:hypothetical protein
MRGDPGCMGGVLMKSEDFWASKAKKKAEVR